MAKLVNSLSWHKKLVLPKPIDKQKTLLRIDIRQLKWTAETWTTIQSLNPYKVVPQSGAAKMVAYATSSAMPIVGKSC